MSNPEQVAALRADVNEWNRWRSENEARPDLTGADLRRINLVFADLRNADLRGADLTLADLEGADLRNADLRGANLIAARLIGVDLQGADLRGADLSTAEDLTVEQMAEAIGDDTTVLPDDTPRPESWAKTQTHIAPGA